MAVGRSSVLSPSAAQFAEDGFQVVTIDGIDDRLQRVRSECFAIFDFIRYSSDKKRVTSDPDVLDFWKESQPRQYQAVKLGYHMPSLYGIVDHAPLISALKALGVQHPILDLEPQLRCDMPVCGQSVFKQHQDWTYNIGSKNAVTAWIPLQDTSVREGAPKVAPGSHKDGIYPHDNGVILDRYRFDFIDCPVRFGEALIFDQKIVHKSGVNMSDGIRFSVQIRYSDLQDEEYASRGWPRNHVRESRGFATPTILSD
jgi:hypothetical protein